MIQYACGELRPVHTIATNMPKTATKWPETATLLPETATLLPEMATLCCRFRFRQQFVAVFGNFIASVDRPLGALWRCYEVAYMSYVV